MFNIHVTLSDIVAIVIIGLFSLCLVIAFGFVWLADRRTRKYDNTYVWDCIMEQRESSSQPVIDPYCTEHHNYGIDDEHCREGKRIQRKYFHQRHMSPHD